MKKILFFTFIIFIGCSEIWGEKEPLCCIGRPSVINFLIDSGIKLDSITIRNSCSSSNTKDCNSNFSNNGKYYSLVLFWDETNQGFIEFIKNRKIVKDTFLFESYKYNEGQYQALKTFKINNTKQVLPFKRYFEDSLIYTIN